MNNSLNVAMLESTQKLGHVVTCLVLIEGSRLLLTDFVQELLALDQFHDQVYVATVIVRLEVLDDVGVVQPVQNLNFFNDLLQIVLHQLLVKHFYRNLEVGVMPIRTGVNFAELAEAQNAS